MADDLTTAGGGIHPGKPVIWPTGKSTPQTPVTQSPTTQTSGGARAGQPAATPAQQAATTEAPSPTQAAQAAAPAAPPAPAAARPEVARQLTAADIRAHLASMQISGTEANVRLATLMIRNGIELSQQNFSKVLTMLEGTNPSLPTQEAAIVLLSKGIDNPTALQQLSQFFASNPQISAQLAGLKDGLANLQTALGIGRGLLPANLIGRLSALMAQMAEFVDMLPKNFRFSGDGKISRENLIQSVRALKSLLQGVQNSQAPSDSAEAQVLSSTLSKLEQQVNDVLQNLTTQAVISQKSDRPEVNYLYYQVPNSAAEAKKTTEIMIRRDGEGPHSKIDPRNTQIVMYLDLENLGKVALVLTVRDKVVYCIFNTQQDEAKRVIVRGEEELRQKLAAREFQMQKFSVNVNPAMCAIKPYLLPMVRLEDLLRIDVQA